MKLPRTLMAFMASAFAMSLLTCSPQNINVTGNSGNVQPNILIGGKNNQVNNASKQVTQNGGNGPQISINPGGNGSGGGNNGGGGTPTPAPIKPAHELLSDFLHMYGLGQCGIPSAGSSLQSLIAEFKNKFSVSTNHQDTIDQVKQYLKSKGVKGGASSLAGVYIILSAIGGNFKAQDQSVLDLDDIIDETKRFKILDTNCNLGFDLEFVVGEATTHYYLKFPN